MTTPSMKNRSIFPTSSSLISSIFSHSPIHLMSLLTQLCSALEAATRSSNESMAFLALGRAGHILKLVNPNHIKTDNNYEMYDIIARERVRTLATLLGEMGASSYAAILLAEHVHSPVVVAVGIDFLVAFSASDLNLPKLCKVGISNVVCVALLRYMVRFLVYTFV
jgi:hypothetical protein